MFNPSDLVTYSNSYGVDVDNVNYEIGESEKAVKPNYYTYIATSSCPLNAKLFVLNPGTN
jgi:hypothetical protein